jgi:hypothetical protein
MKKPMSEVYCPECDYPISHAKDCLIIKQELDWCTIELNNIKAGLFSIYTQDYIEGAISALKLMVSVKDES